MRYFVCLIDTEGQGISETVRQQYESLPRTRSLNFQWHNMPGAAVLVASDGPLSDAPIAYYDEWRCVGEVRLDNRLELERIAGREADVLTDRDLVLRVVARHGIQCVRNILGDFAVVVWNAASRAVLGACDAFAVERLYYRTPQGMVAFGSRAEALAPTEQYELGYLTELLVLHTAPRSSSVFAGVRRVPAASLAVFERGSVVVREYWSPDDLRIEPAWARAEHDAIATCRRLLTESIRARLGGRDETWAQLSGGIDSSSIVSLTQWLVSNGQVPYGLAGTLTYVDRQGTQSDERMYSDAVVRRWPMRNEKVIDAPTWHDGDAFPPLTDEPGFDLPVYPRQMRASAIIRQSGGRILLTGWGGDEVFASSAVFFADWVAQGHLWKAASEMARRAAVGRVSFWELAYKNAFVPLLPQVGQRCLLDDNSIPPDLPWVRKTVLKHYGLDRRAALSTETGGRLRHKYEHAIATKVKTLSAVPERGVLADALTLRHPMLHRPLVEFALTLPPTLRARPHAHRWVLRAALQDCLPERVRMRVGKPGTGDVLAYSLAKEGPWLAKLLAQPVLADLGIVDASKLRRAFEDAPQQTSCANYLQASVQATLAIEAWLQLRSGRWPCGGRR